jgi:Fatty acid desaturase
MYVKTAVFIAVNVEHDGGHQAYSSSPWVNKLTAMTLELIGGSSYLWKWKHVVFHHTYVNVTGHDTDIDLGILARLTPHQTLRSYHRWQHLYLWPLYGLLAIKWQLFDDFRKLITGRISTQRFPRPRGWELVTFAAARRSSSPWPSPSRSTSTRPAPCSSSTRSRRGCSRSRTAWKRRSFRCHERTRGVSNIRGLSIRRRLPSTSRGVAESPRGCSAA